MIATCRIVHYEPDPFTGLRVPLGALVWDGRRWHGVAAEHLPVPDCLGGEEHARMAALLARQVSEVGDATRSEGSLGPFVRFAESRALPAGVEDPVQWVREHLLPRRVAAIRGEGLQRGPTLPSQGYAFFRTFGVSHLVKKTFKPTQDGVRWLEGRGRGLQPITHWVEGRSSLMLMEPVSPSRPQLEDDLQTLATRLLAWRSVLTQPSGTSRLVAYLLTGGRREQRDEVREVLQDKVDLLVDTDDAAARTRFVDEIKAVGGAGGAQPALVS